MRLRIAATSGALLMAVSSAAWAQTGTTYRFQADTLKGTVWVLGDSARRELEAGPGEQAAGSVEIWKNGGKQIFVLNPAERTYYEEKAFRARQGLNDVSIDALTVRAPFRVNGVENVRVALRSSPTIEVISGYECRRAVLTLSYTLKVSLAQSPVPFPARVEASADFCLMDASGVPPLPFGHRLELTSGHQEVDAAVAERVAALKGIPVARMLKVRRRIENGEAVSTTSALLISDVREAAIEQSRFEVPGDYRFQEPTIVGPSRKRP